MIDKNTTFNEPNDFSKLKDYISKLQEDYPNFVTLQSAFFEKDLKSNYLMSDKNFNNFIHLEIKEDGLQEWSNIHPQDAKDMLNQFYFPNKIDEWNLDNIIDKSPNQISNELMNRWMKANSENVEFIDNLDYEKLKIYTDTKKLDRRFLSEDRKEDISPEIEYLNKSLRYLETNVNKKQFELLETFAKSEFYSKYQDSNKGTLVDYAQLQKEFQDSATPRLFIEKVKDYTKDFENSKIDLKELLKKDGISVVDDFSNKRETIQKQYSNIEKKPFKLKEKQHSKNKDMER